MFGLPVGMNAESLLVQEYTKGGDVHVIERLVRLDLGQLDELEGGLE